MVISSKKLQDIQIILLLIGIWAAMLLVFIGGLMYLMQHGQENMRIELLQSGGYQLTLKDMLEQAFALTPLGIIELGLLTLVATQILRVALLAFFYMITRDYWFSVFSIFILIVLTYSFIWQS